MKLIALKWFSDKVPAGASFEMSDADGRALIALNLAREDQPEQKPHQYKRRDMQAEG